MSTYYLGDIAWDTPAPRFHNIHADELPDIALPNFDTDRDAFPGALIAKDAAGIGGSDPTKLLRFSGGFASPLEIDADVHVDLYGAAKDFGRRDIDVQVGVYTCGELSGCSLIDSDTREYKHAHRWRKERFHFPDMQATVGTDEWIEVRVAVLDSSEDDGWFAFGTADYDSRIRIGSDDD